MKKTKLKHRIDNAVNAFFDNNREIYVENNLTFASDSALLKQETAARFNEKADVLVKILKRTFLFLPGAFYLFYGMLLVFTFDFFWNPLTGYNRVSRRRLYDDFRNRQSEKPETFGDSTFNLRGWCCGFCAFFSVWKCQIRFRVWNLLFPAGFNRSVSSKESSR